MTNQELDDLLKKGKVPEPLGEYWNEFPGNVIRVALARRSDHSEHAPTSAQGSISRFVWIGLVGAACILVVLMVGLQGVGRRPPGGSRIIPQKNQLLPLGDLALASVQKYVREIKAEFPNQVRAILFDETGAHLLLSDHADVPGSPPVLLNVCVDRACHRIVTFSGQQVPIQDELCEVLLDGNNHVLVVGQNAIRGSDRPTTIKPGQFRVEAALLPL